MQAVPLLCSSGKSRQPRLTAGAQSPLLFPRLFTVITTVHTPRGQVDSPLSFGQPVLRSFILKGAAVTGVVERRGPGWVPRVTTAAHGGLQAPLGSLGMASSSLLARGLFCRGGACPWALPQEARQARGLPECRGHLPGEPHG